MFDDQERNLLKNFLQDHVEEKKRARRWGIFFKLSIFALIAFTILLSNKDTFDVATSKHSEEHVALIKLDGIILAETDFNFDSVSQRLRDAFENKQSQAVILQINTPGGSAVQAAQINQEIKRLRELHKKPIYTVVSDVCASGGMFIAVATDAIYANRASLIGSIGVILASFGFTGLMDKIGIERRLIVAGEHKAMLDPFSPQNAQETEHTQQLLDTVHKYFIAVVKEGRGDKLVKHDSLYSGLIWDGATAKMLGLIDDFGDVHYVSREIIKNENLVEYEGEQSILSELKKLGSEILFIGLTKLSLHKLIY